MLIAMYFGAQQNARLKFIQIVSISQNERNDAILASRSQVNAKLPGGGINSCLYFGINFLTSLCS